MTKLEFFEQFAGAFILWLIALVISFYSYLSSMPAFIAISLDSTGLFLVFFLTWGIVYTLLYTLVALYFTLSDHLFGSKVPLPPHKTQKVKKGK